MNLNQRAARNVAERESRALRRVGDAVRAAHDAGRQIVTLVKRAGSKLAFDPSNPPSPGDAQKLIAQIADILGVDDPQHADHDTIDKALDALFAAVTGGDAVTDSAIDPKVVANSLTAAQLKICREKGVSPADFLAVKNSMNRPLRRTDAGGGGAVLFGGGRDAGSTSNAGYRRTPR